MNVSDRLLRIKTITFLTYDCKLWYKNLRIIYIFNVQIKVPKNSEISFVIESLIVSFSFQVEKSGFPRIGLNRKVFHLLFSIYFISSYKQFRIVKYLLYVTWLIDKIM